MDNDSEPGDRVSENNNTRNPYQSTELVGRSEPMVLGGITFPGDMKRGWVGHVQILGVLMIIHGIIDVLGAFFTVGYGLMMPSIMRQAGVANGGKPMPPQAEWAMVLIMGGIGVLFLIAGVASIMGGIWAIQLRRRVGVIIGLVAGLAMLLSCYCFPTSLVLMVYGLFVMFCPSVMYAFALREQGHDVKEIQQRFLELRHYVG